MNITSMPEDSDRYLRKLYEMSEGKLRTLDRYEVGKKIGLDKEEVDEVVDELSALGDVKTAIGHTIVISPDAKKILDGE